ncbi:type VI secretion system Vgr family protein [Massilia sp. X63]|uniref:type VI secretion system Vgr family protein n=1 Tax=Massilia sp. X63 TaxID=3237285 RepID=UPI0034DCE36C
MSTELTERIAAALAEFSGTTRFLVLTIGDQARDVASSTLLVEAYAADDSLLGISTCEVIALSTSAHLDVESLLGQPVALGITLADGSLERVGGEIGAIATLGSDGGLARYRIRITPWTWRLAHARNSRVWQDKSIVDIVDEIFAAYSPGARWRWSSDTARVLATVPLRSYCCQYRESDLDFVRRILADEGLGWRIEQTRDGPCLVLFANSTSLDAMPHDPGCRDGTSVRYHGASAVEQKDSVQALVAHRRLHASLTTLQSSDYKSGRLVGASSPSFIHAAGLPELESYDVPGQYAFADLAQARRHANLQMEATEARSQLWQGRSTVRTLRAGTRLTVEATFLQRLGGTAGFTMSRVRSVGVNNMPPPAQQALAELFGPLPELLEKTVEGRLDELALLIDHARTFGYANAFEAIPAEIPWRPQLCCDDDRIRARPTARGAQTAIVIGPDGNTEPIGSDEVYCDRLGRIRIRFHWQDNSNASCWVRVGQRLAGANMGSQFLPRIGQEVLVQFIENDIDRPVVVGALYNGRGEGGIAATPGGRRNEDSRQECFGRAHDHSCSGQGNLTAGNSPVWHGASAGGDGHRNAAAQWGIRTAGLGRAGYNQLLFDDTDGQGRVQLRSTASATELNLGHLHHAADNYRGSFRGRGAELRSDAYGAVRGAAGLLVSSHGITHDARSRDPAGADEAGIALARQAAAAVGTLHAAATAHRTVGLATHAGAGKPNASLLNVETAPLEAFARTVSASVNGTGAAGASAEDPGTGKLPHPDAPVLVVSAHGSLGAAAGQDLQLASGDTTALMSVQDTQLLGGADLRIHAGQAIGALGAAVKAGTDGIGLQLIAAKDAVDLQAQADTSTVQARDDIRVISANAHVDWAAAQRIVLSTAGGASLTIEDGNIGVQCPGKLTVHAATKSLTAPQRLGYPMPALPRSICVQCLKRALAAGAAFSMVE